MKKICVINPNTSTSMTNNIDKVAKSFVSKDTEVLSINPKFGPESIEGYYDEAFCIPGIISEIRANPEYDAYIVACFDDTGLDACRTITDKPVIGIGEASYHAANMLGGHFSVITTLKRSIPALKKNLKNYGLYDNCVSISSVDIPVLELESNLNLTEQKIEEKIKEILDNSDTEIFVLGCAGMADFAVEMKKKYNIPVIEGISVAVKFAEAFVDLNLKTSSRNSFAMPRSKKFTGIFKNFEV